jgi:hypothetical protein
MHDTAQALGTNALAFLRINAALCVHWQFQNHSGIFAVLTQMFRPCTKLTPFAGKGTTDNSQSDPPRARP